MLLIEGDKFYRHSFEEHSLVKNDKKYEMKLWWHCNHKKCRSLPPTTFLRRKFLCSRYFESNQTKISSMQQKTIDQILAGRRTRLMAGFEPGSFTSVVRSTPPSKQSMTDINKSILLEGRGMESALKLNGLRYCIG